MLQSAVRSQLERIGSVRRAHKFAGYGPHVRKPKTSLSIEYPNPHYHFRKTALKTVEMLPENESKHWLGGGPRSSAMAVDCLMRGEVIALPTETCFGFAALAQNTEGVKKLYEIKGREMTKPLAISLASVVEIEQWAEVAHVPNRLILDLLPGPVTIVLKRKETLNPELNPGHDTVGIRVPFTKFIRHVTHAVAQPLALTSANLSKKPSSLHPDEFAPLWPKLAAVFHEIPRPMNDERRVGSTVVDLTVQGEFEILREGVRFQKDLFILQQYGRRRYPAKKTDEIIETDEPLQLVEAKNA